MIDWTSSNISKFIIPLEKNPHRFVRKYLIHLNHLY